jgi:hypothetical protein
MTKRINTMDNGFNEWARQLRVSSLWDAHKLENKEFIKRLEEARFVYTMVNTSGMGGSK